ncbi:MAG: hypothetical protein R3E97_05675 [Candidatus Eisenbacteria bacterium]
MRRRKQQTAIHCPEELIEAAKRHPLGLSFLLDAPFETVSVTFQVCPNVVFAARELLQKAGRPKEGDLAGKNRGSTF